MEETEEEIDETFENPSTLALGSLLSADLDDAEVPAVTQPNTQVATLSTVPRIMRAVSAPPGTCCAAASDFQKSQQPTIGLSEVVRAKVAARKIRERCSSIGVTPPADFMCVFFGDLMEDPVITCDGHTYERAAIAKWLSDHDTSPQTNKKLCTKTLVPNHFARGQIGKWREEHGLPPLSPISHEQEKEQIAHPVDIDGTERGGDRGGSGGSGAESLSALLRGILSDSQQTQAPAETAESMPQEHAAALLVALGAEGDDPRVVADAIAAHDITNINLPVSQLSSSGSSGGIRVLHYASQLGLPNTVAVLVDTFGADVSIGDTRGTTALGYVVRSSLSDELAVTMAGVLLSRGAPSDEEDSDGDGLLTMAIQRGYTQLALCLVEHGFDLRKENNAGNLPMMFAIQIGQLDVVSAMLRSDKSSPILASLAQTRAGITPLIMAVHNEHDEIVHLLISHGADMTISEQAGGRTPLDLAIGKPIFNVLRRALPAVLARRLSSQAPGAFGMSAALTTALQQVSDLSVSDAEAAAALESVRMQSPVALSQEMIHAIERTDIAAMRTVVEGLGGANVPLTLPASISSDRSAGMTALHMAVARQEASMVRELLRLGADPNCEDGSGHSAFHVFLMHQGSGNDLLGKMLVEGGANVQTPNPDSDESLLYSAVGRKQEQFALVLISHGCDLRSPTAEGNNAIVLAAQENMTSIVSAMLAKDTAGPPLADTRQRRNGISSLHLAAYNGLTDMAQLLIAHSAKLGLHDDNGHTPLQLIFSKRLDDGDDGTGQIQTGVVLVNAGADITVTDSQGRNPLFQAIARRWTTLATTLVEHGCDPFQLDCSGNSPFPLAAQEGQLQVVAAVLAMHAATPQDHEGQPRVVDRPQQRLGLTALHLASYCGRLEVVRLLLEHHANVNARDERDLTPFNMLFLNNDPTEEGAMHEETALALVASGADVNTPVTTGGDTDTPLYKAIARGMETLAVALVANDCNLSATNSNGNLAIIAAAQKNQLRVVSAMLDKDPTLINAAQQRLGITSLISAVHNGHEEMVELILSHDPDIMQAEQGGRTALDVASSPDIKHPIFKTLREALRVSMAQCAVSDRLDTLSSDPKLVAALHHVTTLSVSDEEAAAALEAVQMKSALRLRQRGARVPLRDFNNSDLSDPAPVTPGAPALRQNIDALAAALAGAGREQLEEGCAQQ
jgi:ankyrin repeat protein